MAEFLTVCFISFIGAILQLEDRFFLIARTEQDSVTNIKSIGVEKVGTRIR
jgi:hypothetical protein